MTLEFYFSTYTIQIILSILLGMILAMYSIEYGYTLKQSGSNIIFTVLTILITGLILQYLTIIQIIGLSLTFCFGFYSYYLFFKK